VTAFLSSRREKLPRKCILSRFRAKLRLEAATVHVIHPGFTDALNLVEAAITLKEEPHQRLARGELGNRDVEGFDHVWVVFDADVPHRQRQLAPAFDLARYNGIEVALSTPSVELWLLLHFRDRPGPFLDSQAAERALREAWGQTYDKSEATFLRLWQSLSPQIARAVQRASQIRQYHEASGASFPPNPSTDADLLVLAMNAAVQPHLRII